MTPIPSRVASVSSSCTAWVLYSLEGRDAGDLPAEDQGVDLAGALVRGHAFEVVGVPKRRVVQRDAVAAEDGPRLPGDVHGLAHVVELPEGDVFGTHASRVLQPPHVQG